MSSKENHWSSEAYALSAPFVPTLTTRLLTLLDAQEGHRILDLGCGSGLLTSHLSHLVGPTGSVLALDSSPSMISSAATTYPAPNTTYRVHDCARLASDPDAVDGSWDKVFSNAALHWILRDEDTRQAVFGDCFRALKAGGELVFEMGGQGNVGEVEAAVVGALVAEGVEVERAREARGWFFPSEGWMRGVLEGEGFVVEVLETEYRATELTGEAGLEGWVRLMCASMLDLVEGERRERVVRMVGRILERVITREEDGSQWLGYVRLRAVARKP
ncbi:methyltransferase domain-containing protein 18 [Elsinoe australis]|uniref:Methyltransferase domain-containing protein 18 n=1 Tax=Elsinoe australis TaxID=40998 RepID=A0A4U7B3V3_9PEZI|nr:methyltransferase domain-containing protein 18 [Elsinoe australis]